MVINVMELIKKTENKIFYAETEVENLVPEGIESNGFEYHITTITN